MSAHSRLELQNHVFTDDKVRLLDCVKVEETKSRRKKFSWLALTIDLNSKIHVHWIKAKDYSRKARWKLQDIKTVDLKYTDKDTVDFELHLDRVYKWSATNLPEKESFIRSLYRYSATLPKAEQIHFKNVRNDVFEDLQMSAELTAKLQATDCGRDLDVVAEYQALTATEEADLEALMLKYEFAISNAEAFTEQLNRELSSLDAANVHAIMESERKVQGLMDLFDTAIGDVTRLETRLDAYDALLREVRDSVLRMEEKDAVIHVQNDNIDRLRQLLESLISQRDLTHEHEMLLLEPKALDSDEGLAKCIEAALALETAMSVSMHQALNGMTAVQERTKSLENLKRCFSRNLSHFINDQLVKISVDYRSQNRRTIAAGEPVLRKHEFVHNSLRPFSPLMAWLKRNEDAIYAHIKRDYLERFGQIYQQEINVFFEQANAKLRFEESRSASGILDTKKGTLVVSAQEGGASTPTKQRTTCLLGMASDIFCAGEDEAARQMFDLFLERILTSLEPAYLAEQHFCIQFFDLTTQKGARLEGRVEGLPNLDGSALSSGSHTPSKSTSVDELDSVSRTSSEEMMTKLKKRDRDIGQEVRDVMAGLFRSLEEELNKFVQTHDGVYSMYLLVRLCHHTIQTQDAGSYLCKLYGMALVNAKRNFDQYMGAHITSIAEAKPPRRSKCGIVSFVSNFGEFATQCEAVFKGSDRKGDLQKWYSKIVHAIFDGIVRVSVDHGRTPPEVVCMENYHHMFNSLYQLKILEEDRKEAKERYTKALKSYVTNYFGRPLEKLNVFFDGVQARLDTGTKASDVSFYHQYSKSELRKVIHDYPGKEVKKGLEALYKKVEKHLSPEENLLQVVWRHMQDEFIRQYKAIQALLESCYSGSMISLEFTIQDLLEYFSDIAKQH